MSKAKLIMGSALGLAAIAVAIDHTRHRLPEPQAQSGAGQNVIILENPCALEGRNPCSLAAEEPPPCGLEPVNPCSL
jgi:hypothetical protein